MKKVKYRSVAGVAALAVMFATTAAAQASPWNRSRASSQDGELSINSRWVTEGPLKVGMEAKTARSIASRVGVEEFGYRETGATVPCVVAQNVASKVLNAWVQWPGDSGTVGAGWMGYSRGPYMGRFPLHRL